MKDKWTSEKQSKNAPQKGNLHPRNKHQGQYNFKELIKACPDLAQYVSLNEYKIETIDFSDALAVKWLNKALLKVQYGIDQWNIPKNYLCPPIPGRADYIHYMADVLADANNGQIPKGEQISVLDIGVGANLIYPMIGISEYGWKFVGTDIDQEALIAAKKNHANNAQFTDLVELRLQKNTSNIFSGILHPTEHFDFCMSNPPFFRSEEEARNANIKKVSNLKQQKNARPQLNFGGKNIELYCKGGELAFIQNMISESLLCKEQFGFFSSLVSKSEHLKPLLVSLNYHQVPFIKTIEMTQGNKKSRILVWGFNPDYRIKNS